MARGKARNRKTINTSINISDLFNPTTEKSWLFEEYKKFNMKQQTIVEWFNEKLIELDVEFQTELITSKENYWIKRKEIIEQAKQIENKQSVDDYNMGYQDAQCNHINDAENYINEIKYIQSKIEDNAACIKMAIDEYKK